MKQFDHTVEVTVPALGALILKPVDINLRRQTKRK